MGAFVAPAELGDEAVPHVALLITAHGTPGMDPGENIFVATALKRAFFDLGIGHAKETAAAAIERVELRVAEKRNVVGGKLRPGMQPDFVEHAAKVNEAADFGVATAETGDVRHGGIIRRRSLFGK